MDHHTGHIMTLANSIIGVGVLAMPYCFKQCGIVLSILMLLISSIISRLACHFLLKSAIMARRKTFEFLAFHAFGALGKFIIEIGLIGFLIGTCIAFFVVMGDLGPEIISEITGTKTTNTLRTSILMALALFCVLPLGLLRNVDSLNGVSKATIGFYCCLVLKIIVESLPRFFSENWFEKVALWRPAGILQCLPIFSMALFCQTQLFEIYQAMPNASLEKMNNIIRVAVNICTCVYIFVGMFGYIAFFQQPFTGNILMSFKPSIMTDVMKIGFVLSVAFSFPLVIFPCRASLYSLLYKNTYPIHEGSANNYIPEGKFKSLTFLIVFISLVTGVLIPNIELVLGLVGSTIGVIICVLFPVACFISMSPKNTNERILAQIMLFIGVLVMVLGTYANLYAIEEINYTTEKMEVMKSLNLHRENDHIVKNIVIDTPTTGKPVVKIKEDNEIVKSKIVAPVNQEPLKEIRHEPPQPVEPVQLVELPKELRLEPAQTSEPIKEVRHEPPQPVEPADNSRTIKNLLLIKDAPKVVDVKINIEPVKEKQETSVINKPGDENVKQSDKIISSDLKNDQKFQDKREQIEKINELKETDSTDLPIKEKLPPQPQVKDEVDIEAIKKEETELKEQEKEKLKEVVKNQELIDTLQKQNEVQQELVKQQKELIKVIKEQQQALEIEKQQKEIEKLKAVKHIENIAKQAIESLSVKSIVDEPTGKLNEQSRVNNKEILANPAPLSYQLGLNQNKIINITANKRNKYFMDPKDLKKLIPIPIALHDNFSSIYSGKNLKKDDVPAEFENKIIKTIVPQKTEIKEDSPMSVIPHKLANAEDGKVFGKPPADTNRNNKQMMDNTINKEIKVEAIKRDILSHHDELVRKKREAESDKSEFCDKTSENKISTDSPLIKKISRLSDLDLVTVSLAGFDVDNVNLAVKPLKRDLKFVDYKRKK